MEIVMATTYWMGDVEVQGYVQKVMSTWHQMFITAEVKIGVIMCASDKEDVPALKHGGYPALATIKVVPLKDRISKNYDAEMMIDANFWKSTSEDRRLALIDHELCHLRLKEPKAGQANVKSIGDLDILYDDIGRPVLKLVGGDWNVGDGFEEVVRRHGDIAIEVTSVKSIGDRLKLINKGS